MQVVCVTCSPDWITNGRFAAYNFFKSEMEASAFKAEMHRTMLVGRDSEDYLVHPAPSRTTASIWPDRPRLGLATTNTSRDGDSITYLINSFRMASSENVFHNV